MRLLRKCSLFGINKIKLLSLIAVACKLGQDKQWQQRIKKNRNVVMCMWHLLSSKPYVPSWGFRSLGIITLCLWMPAAPSPTRRLCPPQEHLWRPQGSFGNGVGAEWRAQEQAFCSAMEDMTDETWNWTPTQSATPGVSPLHIPQHLAL